MSINFDFFKNSETAKINFNALLKFGNAFSESLQKRMLFELQQHPDPDFILNQFERLSRSVMSATTLFKTLSDYPPLLTRLIRFFTVSPFLSEVFFKDFQYAYLLIKPETECPPFHPDIFNRADNPSYSVTRKISELKLIMRQEILKISIRDFIMNVPVNETVRALSQLTDTIIRRILHLQYEKFSKSPCPFAIIALGKLGGEEINYSSDIDLLAVYKDEGETTLNGTSVSHHEYFNLLIGELVSQLSRESRDGRFFRVDMRLRPDGNSGPLARSAISCQHYYESRGQLWERQMLIKARPVAGDINFGYEFLKQIEPFIYPKTHLESPLNAIRQMRWRIEEKNKSTDGINIKTGTGGIRDIEFIVQALQLLNGGLQKTIRSGNTLNALELLTEHKLLTRDEYQTLYEDYILFRRIEHLLQLRENRQTHEISKPEILSYILGFKNIETFQTKLNQSLSSVREIYSEIFRSENNESRESFLTEFLSENLDSSMDQKLTSLGFSNPIQAHQNIRFLSLGHFPKLYSHTTQQHFSNIAPSLFESISKTAIPDQTLNNIERFSSHQIWIDSWYPSLSKPENMQQAVKIAEMNSSMSMFLSDKPSLWDVFLSGVTISEKDFPDPYLRKKIFFLLNALHFPSQSVEIFYKLSQLAEIIINPIFQKCFENQPVALYAMGKWGGREITFKSDLDVIFVCEDHADIDDLIALGKKFIDDISKTTPEGKLYEIDARLRPEGQQAPLVVTLSRYEEYFKNRAMTWEKQALLKARFVYGDADVREKFDRFLNRTLFGKFKPEMLFEIAEMRRRQIKEKVKNAQSFDLKFSHGGILDIEYYIQAEQWRQNIFETNTLNALRKIKIEESVPQELSAAYLFYRKLEMALFLLLDRRSTKLPTEEKALDFISCFCELKNESDLKELINVHQNFVQSCFADLIKNSGKENL